MHYLQEALGLAIFMISACFFGAMLEGRNSSWHLAIPGSFARTVIMGLLMGLTALLIFYSPFTSPSGSHINPVVTLTFLRLGKMCHWDAVFYVLFQFTGGTVAVFIMQWIMGSILTNPPVNSVATIPGNSGIVPAFAMEFFMAFVTMTMVLFTSASKKFKNFTRIFAGCLVCTWVITGGRISGFGMNPARTFASALPAHIWTAYWLYVLAPLTGMLTAAEFFTRYNSKKENMRVKKLNRQIKTA